MKQENYLVLIILLRKLDVDIVLSADVCNNGPLAANNFGVILGVHSDGQLKTPERLRREKKKKKKPLVNLLKCHFSIYSNTKSY